jgi:hypothetical protein
LRCNMVLNPTLYALLLQEFGQVGVAHGGYKMTKNYEYDYSVHPPRLRLRPPNGEYGEYYKVSCPYCNDTKERLWLNHWWGVWDPIVQSYNLWLAVCYNEQCTSDYEVRKELYNTVYGFKNIDQRTNPIEILSGNEAEELRPVEYPGDWAYLTDVPSDWAAPTYLRERGFALAELVDKYKVAVCVNPLPEYRSTEGRIIIPIFMDDMLVGWQCRHPFDMDWKNTAIPKYYNLPGMRRRQILYNYDRAGKCPYPVLVEGVTGVWRLGGPAIASLGKTLARPQIERIIKTWQHVVVMMDGDEPGQEAAEEICDTLGRYISYTRVTLPPGYDPGCVDAGWAWELIRQTALRDGVDLDKLESKRGEEDDRTGTGQTARNVQGDGGIDRPGCPGEGERTHIEGVSANPARRPGYAAPRTQLYKTGRILGRGEDRHGR